MLDGLLSAAVTHRRRGTARELFCPLRELLRQAVVPVAVVQMKSNKMAIFIHPNRRDIVDTDSASTYVAKLHSFDAHCNLRSALPYIP